MLILSDAFAPATRFAKLLKPFAAFSILAFLAVPASAETVAWWRFEEGTPNTRAAGTGNIFDVAGSFLNGTPFDSPIYRETPVLNSWLGLEFTGGGTGTQRVFVPDSPRLYVTKSLTLEAFLRYDGIPTPDTLASQIVFRGDSRDALDPYTLAIRKNGRLFLDISSLTERVQLESPMSLPIGQYVHVAGTLDDATGEMKLFINGVEVASKITAARPFGALTGPNPGIGIGNVQSNNSKQGFGGIIDEVRISDVALTPAEFLNGGSVDGNAPEPGFSISQGATTTPAPVVIKRRRNNVLRSVVPKNRVP